jgi:hypothetical protein
MQFSDNTSSPFVGAIEYSHSSNALMFYTDGSQRMRIHSSGKVSIGTSTADGILIVTDNDNETYLVVQNAKSGGSGEGVLSLKNDVGNWQVKCFTDDSFRIRDNANGADRLTINTSGQILIGTTSAGALTNTKQLTTHDGNSTYGLRLNSTNTSGTQYHQSFDRNGTQAGYITSNSATTIAVNNASDERLKENIENSGSAIQDIKDLKVRQFDWIDGIDTHRDFGFVAQELVNVIPEAVAVGSDELDDNGKPKQSWGVDYSHIIPRLVKAVQEQQTKIESLEARITTLENA